MMKKYIFIFKTIFVLLVFLTTFSFAADNSVINKESAKEKLVGSKAGGFTDDGFIYVYDDNGSKLNHKTSSGWMGDYGDITLDLNWEENPQSGTTCMKWTYTAEGKQGAGHAGCFWQQSSGWGYKKSGYDLSQAKILTFWVRGQVGQEKIKFQLGGMRNGPYVDSCEKKTEVVNLTQEWQKFIISLDGLDLSYIEGVFAWMTDKEMNPDGCVFYLDNIRYEK